MPTMGLASCTAPVEPWKRASPKENTPPSDATSQMSHTRAAVNTAVGEAIKPGGNGYWAVYPDGTVEAASDGGVFSFGGAPFYGSMGGRPLVAPIVGMAPTPDGHGYWLVAADGGVFSFGDARFYGSTGGIRLNQPIVGMAPTPDGHGYWLVAADGGVFTYGDARFHGSGSGTLPQQGVRAVAVAGDGQGGYWIETSSGTPLAFDAPLSAQSPAQPAGSTAVAATQLAPSQTPDRSIAPSTAFQSSCFGPSASVASCNSAALADINSARADEGYGPLPLPADYGSLSLQAQLIATANAERTSRGLPAFPEDPSVDAMAQQGAQQGTDPVGPAGYGWSSNWAENYPTALAADFVWMYDDGTGSPNIDCTAANDSGCWGHRRNILSPWAGRAGAGVSDNNGSLNLTQLFVEG